MSDLTHFLEDVIKITKRYSFDTSAFIESWRRFYPKDLFPRVWEFVKEKILNKTIFVSSVVEIELNFQQDKLTKWANQFQPFLFNPIKKSNAM